MSASQIGQLNYVSLNIEIYIFIAQHDDRYSSEDSSATEQHDSWNLILRLQAGLRGSVACQSKRNSDIETYILQGQEDELAVKIQF